MYALVGCTECSALWIIDGRPDRTTCPRCDRSHQTTSLKKFVETEDKPHAREVRASMLATRQDEGEAFAQLDHVEEQEARLEDAGIDDETYLAASGLDPESISGGADRATDRGSGSGSHREIVVSAIDELDPATEERILEHATEAGVPSASVRRALEKLRRRGEVTLDGGEYRVL
jgi:hypothetical protein